MDETPQQPVTVAEVARVGIDLPCIACGYNLRSLPMSGRCPECNSAIESALHHGWLIFADPQWLRRLRSGVTLILWTLLAMVLDFIGFMFNLNIMFVMSSGTPSELIILAPYIMIGVGIAAAWLASVFKLTTPEPTHEPDGRPQRGTLAKWILVLNTLPIFSVILSAFWIGLIITDFSRFEIPDSVFMLSASGGFAAILASMVGLFLLMILMRRLARKVPRQGLCKLMSVLIWGSAGMILLNVGAGLFAAGSGIMVPSTVVSGPFGLVPIPTMGPVTNAIRHGLDWLAGFFGGSLFFRNTFFLIFKCVAIGWSVCNLVALFWFRRVFSRAIAQSAAHPFHAVP